MFAKLKYIVFTMSSFNGDSLGLGLIENVSLPDIQKTKYYYFLKKRTTQPKENVLIIIKMYRMKKVEFHQTPIINICV